VAKVLQQPENSQQQKAHFKNQIKKFKSKMTDKQHSHLVKITNAYNQDAIMFHPPPIPAPQSSSKASK